MRFNGQPEQSENTLELPAVVYEVTAQLITEVDDAANNLLPENNPTVQAYMAKIIPLQRTETQTAPIDYPPRQLTADEANRAATMYATSKDKIDFEDLTNLREAV